MNNPIIFAKEHLNVSYEDLAKLLGTSKQTVLSYKEKPESIKADILVKLVGLTGCDLNTIYNMKMVEAGPTLEKTYDKASKNIITRLSKAREAVHSLEELEGKTDNELFNFKRDKAVSDITNIIQIAESETRKLRVAAVGHSDSGKSTLENYLLGDSILAAEFTETTSTIIYLHGIEDRPSYMSGLDDTVVIGAKKNSKGKIPSTKLHFTQYDNLDEKNIIAVGNHSVILDAYSTRKGVFSKCEDYRVDVVHVFLDNDFLREVDVIDFPGYGTGETSEDVSITEKVWNDVDIVFYLSPANSFLTEKEEKQVVQEILNSRGARGKSLDSFYLLATHSNAVSNSKFVDDIFKTKVFDLVDNMSDGMCERIGISISDHSKLLERCFGFAPGMSFYTEKLNKDLTEKIPSLTKEKISAADSSLRDASKSYKEILKTECEEDKKSIESEKIDKKDCEAQVEASKKKISEIRNELQKSIRKHQKDCVKAFSTKYDDFIEVKHIEHLLEAKKVKNKKESLNSFASYLNNEINDDLSEILKKHSEKFHDEVEESIESYKDVWTSNSSINVNVSMDSFNFQRAFATGLTGVSVFGALAFWAAMVAGTSNLGGYILLAKAVSALSALGISVGGTAAASAAVAAIGGPVVLGIALAAIAAITAFGIFTGTWKKAVAKKIVKAYDDEGVKESLIERITDYWMETMEALNACLESMHNEAVQEFMVKATSRAYSDEEIRVIKELYDQLEEKATSIFDIID